jgi:rod shape-determining protein MreD
VELRTLIFTILILLNFTLQSTVFSYIELFSVAPNTALIIVVSYAMLRGDVEGALVGFLAGLLIDVFFGGPLGLFALMYAVTGFLCAKPFRDFIRENYLLPIVLVIAASLALESVSFGVLYALRGNAEYMYYLRTRIIPLTIYTVLLCVPIYALVYKVNKILEKRQRD